MAGLGKPLTALDRMDGGVGLTCCLTPLLPLVPGGAGLTGVPAPIYRDSVVRPFAAMAFAVIAAGILMMRPAP